MDFADLRDSTRTFAGLLAYHADYMAITESGKSERNYGTLASSNYFEELGVRPILGPERSFKVRIAPLIRQREPGNPVTHIGPGRIAIIGSPDVARPHFGCDGSPASRSRRNSRIAAAFSVRS